MKRLIQCLLGIFIIYSVVSCKKEMSVEQAAPAHGSLQNSAGDCLPKNIGGTFIANKALGDSNFMEVTVNVLKTGAYLIVTDTVNGYSFKGTGLFATTGSTKVKLQGSGKPATDGIDEFIVLFDTTSCIINVTVLPAGSTGGPATFTLSTSGNACANFLINGSYVKGVTLDGTNSVGVEVNVTAPGTYSLTTATVNGYSFSATGVFSSPGVQPVILTGSGNPVLAQRDSFIVRAGATACGFGVTVSATAPPPLNSTDYFPTTLNSWWSYDDLSSTPDTLKRTNIGPTTLGGTVFQQFVTKDDFGNSDTSYYRKDAATGYYYESVDTTGSGADQITFNQPRLNILFLKNQLNTSDTWNTDVTGTFLGLPAVFRFKFNCVQANMSLMVNGKSFNSVYHVQLIIQTNVSNTGFTNASGPADFYYAKGIGAIRIKDDTTFTGDIRSWQIN